MIGGPKVGQLLYQLLLPWYVLTKKYDLWIESFTPPISTGLVPLFTKKPVIGLVHMLSGEDMKRKYHIPFDRVESVGLKLYSHFITPSNAIQQSVAKHNKKAEIVVIPNGVTLPQQTGGTKKYLLFLGRIEIDQKGIDLLLQGYSSSRKKLPYTLVIAGGGEAKQIQKLNQLIQDYHLEGSVEYRGRVTGQEKLTLLNEAKCLIVSSRFETFSLVSLEALANGVPLITFGIPGLSWIPRHARIIVEAYNSKALGKAMVEIVNDDALAASLRHNGKIFAKKSSWESVTKSYATFLKHVLSYE